MLQAPGILSPRWDSARATKRLVTTAARGRFKGSRGPSWHAACTSTSTTTSNNSIRRVSAHALSQRWFTPAMYACMTLFVFHSRHINMITFHVPSNGKHTLARIQARAHATRSLTHSIPHPHFYHTNVDLHTHQNVTSDCYLQCYDTATNQMTHEQLMAPWIKSFSSTDPTQGGCPDAPKYLL